MEKMFRSTSVTLVGILFITLMQVSTAAENQWNNSELLKKLEDFHADFVSHHQNSTSNPLLHTQDNVYLNCASKKITDLRHKTADLMPLSSPLKEDVRLNESHSIEKVHDILAINAIRERNLVFEDSQEPEGNLANSLDVGVIGGQDASKERLKELSKAQGIERFPDKARISGAQNNGISGKNSGGDLGTQRVGNYLDIGVTGITVNAINTVRGGSAMATSNIIINPIQIMACPSEIEEKLK